MIDWVGLRRLTAARIGLARAGSAIATADHLAFQAAHALARDAVHAPLDLEALAEAVAALGLQPVALRSACADGTEFLTRPDLGRRLAPESLAALSRMASADAASVPAAPSAAPCDVAFVMVGGLSAVAVQRHAAPLLGAVLPRLRARGWSIGPVGLVGHGRVALGDVVGEALGARLVVVLIGERPGLSAPDSLGAYVTWGPRPGRSDAERNCLSNIRPEGMGTEAAAARLAWLMQAAGERGLTGVALKDESDVAVLGAGEAGRIGGGTG